MVIKPICNEEDYKNTLKEIELLWDSPVGSPEGDWMEVLVTFVEAYETEHYPVPVIDVSKASGNSITKKQVRQPPHITKPT